VKKNELRANCRRAAGPVGQPTLCGAPRPILAAVLVAALALLGSMPLAQAQAEEPTEHQIKAAFLYNFAKFVEWPPEAFAGAHAPIVLGIVGEDPFGSALDGMVAGKAVNGRALVVKRLTLGPELRFCHILFISSSEKKHLGRILELLKGSSVLTVGEMSRFVQSGGAVNFVLDENRVRFEVNVDAATRARLKVSAKLLALARSVIDDRSEGRN